MQLMAKSNLNISSEGEADEDSGFENSDTSGDGKTDLSKLANRLRLVSLAGLTRSERSVLAAIAKACVSLKIVFRSL